MIQPADEIRQAVELTGRIEWSLCRSLLNKKRSSEEKMDRDVTETEFINMLEKGQRVFNKICVEQGAFKGVDLSGLTFEECLFSVDFSDSKLENTKFINSNLKTCIFTDCILNKAVFVGNYLDGTNFSGAKVEGITFKTIPFMLTCSRSHILPR
ncbi:pentapeptide repeat-containing protein [Cohnella ginsengisoli]|uniref:pentapeptide repeat-containing protein n=1 Tax=Cohnella ginsengisoli TaxID=425004 RepID=UPI003B8A6911